MTKRVDMVCKVGGDADLEKHEKITQSKFYIFFLHKPFFGFYKGNHGKNEEIYTDLKKVGFQVCIYFSRSASLLMSVHMQLGHPG